MNNPFTKTVINPGLGVGVINALNGNIEDIETAFDVIIDEEEAKTRATHRDAVITGFGVTVDTGLYVYVSTGEAIISGLRVVNDTQDNLLLTASKNNFIDVSKEGVYTVTAVTIGNAEPAIATDNIRIAMVVTGASSITKIYDKRTYTSNNVPVKFTPEGGVAVLVTVSEAVVRGNALFLATTGSANIFSLVPANADNPTGIAYEDIAAGCKGWMVVSGYAYVLPLTTIQMAKGDHVYVSSTVAGRAESQSTVNTNRHWGEIGHCCETTSGVGVAGLCILHFN